MHDTHDSTRNQEKKRWVPLALPVRALPASDFCLRSGRRDNGRDGKMRGRKITRISITVFLFSASHFSAFYHISVSSNQGATGDAFQSSVARRAGDLRSGRVAWSGDRPQHVACPAGPLAFAATRLKLNAPQIELFPSRRIVRIRGDLELGATGRPRPKLYLDPSIQIALNRKALAKEGANHRV